LPSIQFSKSNNRLDSYLEFIDNIPAGIFRTTLEGKLVYCNRAYAHLFGFGSPRELINYPVVNLYRNKKDRGALMRTLLREGRIADVPVAFIKKDGTPIQCQVTARAIFDEDGIAMMLDGIIKDITWEWVGNRHRPSPTIDNSINDTRDVIFILDLQGTLLDINQAGVEFLRQSKQRLLNCSLLNHIEPKFRDIYLLLLSDILKIGREEVILTIRDTENREYFIELCACLVKSNGVPHHIKCVARNVTNKLRQQQKDREEEKLQGVLEMAGGVAHRLTQPLTVINNELSAILDDFTSDHHHYTRLSKIHNQVEKINDIANKIRKIKKYVAMDYVGGHKIVDIDKAT
jgi:PAS domain S-box-containing protein